MVGMFLYPHASNAVIWVARLGFLFKAKSINKFHWFEKTAIECKYLQLFIVVENS